MEFQVQQHSSETPDDMAPEQWMLPHGQGSDFPLQGFAVTVRSEPCLAVEDAVGCAAQVLVGQAWITAEGASRDRLVNAGTTVPLELGVRFNVSAFRDIATVLITTPRLSHDVGFSLQQRDGMRVLTVTAGTSRLPTSLAGTPAAIAAFARNNNRKNARVFAVRFCADGRKSLVSATSTLA
jgi:hypothetical protein